jgi:hypothetical protein
MSAKSLDDTSVLTDLNDDPGSLYTLTEKQIITAWLTSEAHPEVTLGGSLRSNLFGLFNAIPVEDEIEADPQNPEG